MHGLEVRNVHGSMPLREGSLVIAHTKARVVVGKVAACYVKVGQRHGWKRQMCTTSGIQQVAES